MLQHQEIVMRKLNSTATVQELEGLLIFHNRQIEWMQHERLIHLIVTLFTSAADLFLFYIILAKGVFSNVLTIGLLILLVLTLFYFIHYYRLENGVQKWYKLSNSIQEKIDSIKYQN
jgi:hypothetical protein